MEGMVSPVAIALLLPPPPPRFAAPFSVRIGAKTPPPAIVLRTITLFFVIFFFVGCPLLDE